LRESDYSIIEPQWTATDYLIEGKLRNDKDATPAAGEPSADTPRLKRPAQARPPAELNFF